MRRFVELIVLTTVTVWSSVHAVDADQEVTDDRTTTRTATATVSLITSLTKSRRELPEMEFEEFTSSARYHFDDDNVNASAGAAARDKGMQMVYRAVTWIVQSISKPFPHEYLLTDDILLAPSRWLEHLQTNQSFQRKLIEFEQNYVIAGGVLLAVVALFSVGFVLFMCVRCCCLCCCQGDAKKQSRADQRFDACRRRSYTSILAVITVIMIFCVACALITNQYAHDGATNLSTRLTGTVDDIRTYRDVTDKQIQKLLIDDYRVFNNSLLAAIDQMADVVVEQLKTTTGAISLDRLSQISNEANDSMRFLVNMKGDIEDIEKEAHRLVADMSKLQRNTEQSLDGCIQTASTADYVRRLCRDMLATYKDIVKALPTPDNYLDLSEFTKIEGELATIIDSNVSGLVLDGIVEFRGLRQRVQDEIEDKRKQVYGQLATLGADLKQQAYTISNKMQDVDVSNVYKDIRHLNDEMTEYEQYRWIGSAVLMAPMALAVLCLGLGLFYGCCGRRPSYYEDDCCVKSTGANLFCAAIAFGVLFLWLFTAAVVALFFVGGNFYWMICDPMIRPLQRPDAISFLERYMHRREMREVVSSQAAYDTLQNTSLTLLIQGCDNNETFYVMFNLARYYNLQDVREQHQPYFNKLDETIRLLDELQLNERLRSLLSGDVKEQLRRLADQEVPGLSEQVIKQIRSRVTDLEHVKTGANKLRQWLTEHSRYNDANMQLLQDLVVETEKLERDRAAPLRAKLNTFADELEKKSKELPALTASIPELLTMLDHAQQVLSANLSRELRAVAEEVVGQISLYVDGYVDHLEAEINTNTTSCKPVRKIVKSAVNALCRDTVNPFNGYWASCGLCIILAIPALILATSLRDLYQNTEPYTGIDYAAQESANTTPRHRRLSAFMTDTYDHTYRRLNGTTPKRGHDNYVGYAAYRNGGAHSSAAAVFDDIASPSAPPPYSSSSQPHYVRR